MAVQQILVLLVLVRIQVGQQGLFNLLDENDSISSEIVESLDDHTKRQLKRILRQKDRTKKIVELFETSEGIDIRSGMAISLKGNAVPWTFYHKQLEETVAGATPTRRIIPDN